MSRRPALRTLGGRERGRRDRAVRYGRAVAVAAALAGVLAAAACSGSDPAASHPRAARSQPQPQPQAGSAAYARHPRTTVQYRYMTDLPDGGTGARYGYNLVDLGPYPSLIDALPDGVQALVWIGDYSHDTCSFSRSDADVRAAVSSVADDPKVAGFYIDDEADYALPADGGHCPDVVAQVTARAALVHELAPSKFTYQVVSDPNNYAAFAHATDVMGATAFPCQVGQGCDWSMIPSRIAALDAAHVAHYWAVLDAFGGVDQWRWPTPAELTRMILQWQQSRWEGQQTFAWTWRGSVLSSRPSILDVLNRLNTGHLQTSSG